MNCWDSYFPNSMSTHKGPPVALISPTVTKGDHPYAILKVKHSIDTDAADGNDKDVGNPTSHSTQKNPSSADAVTALTIFGDQPKTILCTYSIPSHLAISEFLEFVAAVDPFVSHYRVMRCDNTRPDFYMILMKFRDPYSADNYFKQYNNRLFSSMEPEKCQIVYIETIEIDSIIIPSYSFALLEEQQTASNTKKKQTYDECNCPVCLEPMDEKTTSLLTILCQHTFHCHCLSKWNDGSCPVCRYSYNNNGKASIVLMNHSIDTATAALDKLPTQLAQQQRPPLPLLSATQTTANVCSICNTSQHLWICLICGYIGCGRYENAHAYEHYQQTKHIYSLEIETQRVWDYAGDGYVHRLIQNAVDGKLVEVPADGENGCQVSDNEKLEALSIEYSYLLTSQLDSQRMYYETQIDDFETKIADMESLLSSLSTESDMLVKENRVLETGIVEMEKQSETMTRQIDVEENDVEAWKQKYDAAKEKLDLEKEKTNTLVAKNDEALRLLTEQDSMIDNLKEQIRDMTFFLEARQKVQDDPNLEGGSVEVAPRPKQSRKKKGKKRS
ncbi:hypothetical protein BDF20DRAFT_295627 [Mycotypha africana]|uniref:uncharacterized protein n=1 Tax=Mycotypha africana TaxID=64632 RepID=UPI002301D309|nr:uncharacterized protein BDF20DRAFT_295627 [Mycotypha africana]KAI8987919.1 hypothetical protein BDF20DRAFT_295627 [Mycotypha africana]